MSSFNYVYTRNDTSINYLDLELTLCDMCLRVIRDQLNNSTSFEGLYRCCLPQQYVDSLESGRQNYFYGKCNCSYSDRKFLLCSSNVLSIKFICFKGLIHDIRDTNLIYKINFHITNESRKRVLNIISDFLQKI